MRGEKVDAGRVSPTTRGSEPGRLVCAPASTPESYAPHGPISSGSGGIEEKGRVYVRDSRGRFARVPHASDERLYAWIIAFANRREWRHATLTPLHEMRSKEFELLKGSVD